VSCRSVMPEEKNHNTTPPVRWIAEPKFDENAEKWGKFQHHPEISASAARRGTGRRGMGYLVIRLALMRDTVGAGLRSLFAAIGSGCKATRIGGYCAARIVKGWLDAEELDSQPAPTDHKRYRIQYPDLAST